MKPHEPKVELSKSASPAPPDTLSLYRHEKDFHDDSFISLCPYTTYPSHYEELRGRRGGHRHGVVEHLQFVDPGGGRGREQLSVRLQLGLVQRRPLHTLFLVITDFVVLPDLHIC